MISTLAMPAAPETPSQHSAPTPADHCSQQAPLPAHHQHTGSSNVLLSELAAAASAASAASRGIVLPPLRSLVDTSQPSSGAQSSQSSNAGAPSTEPGASLPATGSPDASSAHAQPPQQSSQGPNGNRFADAPIIALSQAPPPPESHPQVALSAQPAPSVASSQLRPPMHMSNPTSPGLDAPITRGSSAMSQHSSMVSSATPLAQSPPGHTQISSVPAHLASSPAGSAPQAHQRVLAPAPSPLISVPHGQVASPHAQMHHPQQSQHHQAPHQQAHEQHLSHQQAHPTVLQSTHNPQPAVPQGSIPGAHGAAPLRPPNAPQVVYVNPYGYPYDAMYMYQPPPLAHYGYAHHHPNYSTPVPMMPMPQPQPQPQHPVAHSPLSHAPPAVAPGAQGSTSAGGAPMDMKPGLSVPQHIMQPWAHTFSQEIKRRTRTGCLTCRRRRVKCDEQHPQCRNCLKSERVCLGYDVIFSFDRAKRADHLMHRRRLYRAARKSHANARRVSSDKPSNNEGEASAANSPSVSHSSKNFATIAMKPESVKSESGSSGDEADEGERIVLRSWANVVDMFRNRLAGPLDEMLGSDMFVNIARRTADYLNAADQRFVNVAGELEAMRQLLSVVYPAFSFEGLNILESQIALEKLRTTEDYCLLRGVAECLSAEESGASIQEMISPSAVVRRTIHQQHLQRIYTRLALLHRVLHPRRGDVYAFARPESMRSLNGAAQSFLAATTDDQQQTRLNDMLWEYLNDIVPGGSNSGNSLNVSVPSDSSTDPRDIPSIVHLAETNDSRGILILLAIYAKRPSEGSLHDLLNTLRLQGLPMALLEIGMASRT